MFLKIVLAKKKNGLDGDNLQLINQAGKCMFLMSRILHIHAL